MVFPVSSDDGGTVPRSRAHPTEVVGHLEQACRNEVQSLQDLIFPLVRGPGLKAFVLPGRSGKASFGVVRDNPLAVACGDGKSGMKGENLALSGSKGKIAEPWVAGHAESLAENDLLRMGPFLLRECAVQPAVILPEFFLRVSEETGDVQLPGKMNSASEGGIKTETLVVFGRTSLGVIGKEVGSL